MPTLKTQKEVLYTQQGMINTLSKSKTGEGKRALEVLKPQFEKNLSLYNKALQKYKGK